ncbi:3'-5' exonuclease [Pandoraea terrae]|uniref:3'-5' exonuclease n=1 Tax=Pandoraea terrae TaxID=1537710 RepID=UPI001CD3A8DE|nr:3'-5' exonuclease [Pandoraea terrae]
MPTPVLVFDIETIPDVDGLRRLDPALAGLSDDAVAEAAFAARREKVGHDFLPLHLHRVAAISCVFRDRDGLRVKSIGTLEDGEGALVSAFYRTIEKYAPQLVSWNGGGFDLPVLHYRGLIHGVQAPRYWDMGEDDREFKWNNYISRYHSRHLDLMDLLAMYQARANAPLDDLAKLCGFPGKLGMDGSKVWEAYRQGNLAEIRNYCETDVVNTYLVYCRFQLMRGGLRMAEYEQEIEFVKRSLADEAAPHWKEYLAAFG